MNKVLAPALNEKLIAMASKLVFEAKDIAPNTYADLRANTGSLVVFAGASDSTIYGDPYVNWCFRAFHDYLHISMNAEFSLEGEILVAREHARLIGSDGLGDILMAEVKGQVEYFAKHGAFPVNQYEFIAGYLKSAS